MMILEVQHISKKYNTHQVLNDISFSAKKGEVIGFLGPNGAGKTTTMKIITGCLDADEGNVFIEKKLIGYLPEDNPLYEEMYVVEYLEYVAKLYASDVSANDLKKQVRTAIEQVGLTPEVHKQISQLSKGYKQRVGLAQAIIHNPDLLILDEPTSGLDPNQIDEIKNLLRELSKDKAILFSSHTLVDVASICTRIIIIHKGNIVADKLIDEIDDLEILFKSLTKG
ncbi:MAG: ATP-binding cassette domain-containing protein [Dysgonamonadaceae bacterium]|jgi:ABC-2 type transport system ATP-binding protein|nr:ATP-binding cassette domain-containing protein [Dysgonamonadaceae bacterium]